MTDPNKSVFRRVLAALREAGVTFTQLHHDPAFTSEEAAAARGTALHSGAKALIVKGGADFLMCVMPADLSLDSNAVRKLLRLRRLRFATREEVFSLTRLTSGAIPPLGSLFGLPTTCDERLAENERINFNAGSHSDSVQMDYAAYVAYESPRIARIAKPRDA